MKAKRYSISVLLPTRGRRETLDRSVSSLIDHADKPDNLQWLFGWDDDDTETYHWFESNVLPKIQSTGARYTCMQFPPLGYGRLHEYVNALAARATGDWFVFWNDDAEMLDPHWDTVITSYQDRFCLQAFDTHKKHPYSIFPIVPRAWYDEIGHLSLHPLNDAWLSQIAWLLDVVVRLDICVEHQRFDLTGNNNDDTFRNRVIYEGNVNDPRDFNHSENRRIRNQEANQLARYLGGLGYDMTHWNEVAQGQRDPWEKMLASDVNNQMMRYK